MVAIFEKKYIEGTDTDNQMKFPNDDDVNLPPDWKNLKSGERQTFPVYDDEGKKWELTIEKKTRGIYFTKGWREFRKEKDIQVGHKISLYKDDDSGAVGYTIVVKKN